MHLSAAEGWFGLGDTMAAIAELDHITPALRAHPAVLEVRWQIYAKEKCWDTCIEIATSLTQLVPDEVNHWVHLAYSTRQAVPDPLEPFNRVIGLF
jgi:hypothetical protein